MHSLILTLACLLFSPNLTRASSLSSSAKTNLRFLHTGYNASIRENCRPRTYVRSDLLIGVSLENVPDSVRVNFVIIDGDDDGFFTTETEIIGGIAILHIRTKTGLTDVLNRERKSQYILTIKCDARKSHNSYFASAITLVRIRVLDVNDNVPFFYKNSYKVSVPEDTEIHTKLIKVSAEDADSGQSGEVYYSLLDPFNNYFSVDPSSGVVSLTRRLDGSVRTNHRIVIVAQDKGAKSKSQTKFALSKAVVKIKVIKVNLHSPLLKINQLSKIIEHSHINIYAIITASDKDKGKNGNIKSVEIVGGNADKVFNIQKGSKKNVYNLVVLKSIDKKLSSRDYNLTIQVTDGGNLARFSESNIRVQIVNVNDQNPVFAKTYYEESVSEAAPPNTAVVRVAAPGIDQGINAKVSFRIVAGNEQEKFKMNQRTGLISTNDWLDAESTSYFNLAVAAINQASSARRKQSSAKVKIKVIDFNDNAPVVKLPNSEISIDENEPTGSYVTRVIASDVDSDENGFISFTIVNLDEVPFNIDPFDGTITTSEVLDFESQRRSYTIKVRASDWGQPLKRETEMTVKVNIKDVNDNRPVFVGNLCSGWINIDTPGGLLVTQFQAIDLDDGNEVRYRLGESDFSDCWNLDGNSGAITLNCNLRHKLTYHKQRTIVIKISATDGRHVSDIASLSLAVIDKKQEAMNSNQKYSRIACEETNILNKKAEIDKIATSVNKEAESFALFPPRYFDNIHSPTFPQDFPESVDVYENVKIGYELLKVAAKDIDKGYNGKLVYSISGGNIDSAFNIDTFTSLIYVDDVLDREKTPKYVLEISVYDLGFPHKFVSRSINVNILDVNDNAPKFNKMNYFYQIHENSLNETSIAFLNAEDSDSGVNGLVSYEILTRPKEFAIHPKSGLLYVSGEIDREKQDLFHFTVKATDGAISDQKFSLAKVTIEILDMNDCAPDFGEAKNLISYVAEDTPVGAVVTTIQASDDDLTSSLSYSLTSGHENFFRIDSKTGIIRVASNLDYEIRQVFNISVKVRDGGFPILSSTTSLLIQVINVDENANPPEIGRRVYTASIGENEVSGSYITTIEASDPDGSRISFSIIGGSGLGLFSINKKGEIHTLRKLDRERSQGYWLTITASDNGVLPLKDTCHVYVHVLDVNDYTPETENPVYRPSVREDSSIGHTVVVLKASDGDSSDTSNVTFFVSRTRSRRNEWVLKPFQSEEDADQVFSVHGKTGVVKTKSRLDRERQSEYELWISVTDGERTSHTLVFVTVTDVNDNAPTFLEKIYRFNVPASPKSRPKPIFRVFARDDDVGRNGDIDYSLKSRQKSRFKIDAKTGIVSTSKSLPAGQTFQLTIKATDRGIPRLTAMAHVIVRAIAVPETSNNAPVIEKLSTVHVMETDPVGHVLAYVNAADLDSDTLWFYIKDGDPDHEFDIGLDSGFLRLAKRLNREYRHQYDLTISVSDAVLSTETNVKILVMDYNDHRPTFTEPMYETTVSETTTVGTTLLTLVCHDSDKLTTLQHDVDTASLFYTMHHATHVSTEEIFVIRSTTGEVVLAKPLNREAASDHVMTVACNDQGGIKREDFARVIIHVKDANDHAPRFLESILVAQVSHGVGIGSLVLRIVAMDEDEGENGRVSYSIIEGNSGGTFRIDEDSGMITIAQPLERKDQNREYLLLVRAMDHAHVPKSSSIPVRITVHSSPNIPPVWGDWDGRGPYKTIQLSEWTTVNSVVAVASSTTQASLLYEIADLDDAETFFVSPSSGIISLKAELDYEKVQQYNITVRATNLDGISSHVWIIVRVVDENDWSPEWKKLTYQGLVLDSAQIDSLVLDFNFGNEFVEFSGLKNEHFKNFYSTGFKNGENRLVSSSKNDGKRQIIGLNINNAEDFRHGVSKSLRVEAFDRDTDSNARLSYSILQKSVREFFKINEFTGAIQVAAPLQKISDSTIDFQVWVRDNGKTRRECLTSSTVKIYVKPTGFDSLYFKKSLYKTSFFLPTVIGVKITCVQAVLSLDSHEVAASKLRPVRYLISDADDRAIKFKIDSHNGCIYVSNNSDFSKTYNLTINATYNGIISATTQVFIKVKNWPKRGLKFDKSSYRENILENTSNELNVLKVGVKNLSVNVPIEYTLLNELEYFEMKPTSGVLRTKGKPFDWEKQDEFILLVKATQLEGKRKVGHTRVIISVVDVNDNAPAFVGQPYESLVTTDAQPGHVVIKLQAIDPDSESYGVVRYELVRGSGELFRVVKETGEIVLRQRLDEPRKTFSLTVAAYDGGKQPLSSQAHVIIRVVSAHGPQFEEIMHEISVLESTPVDAVLLKVTAKSTSQNQLFYSVVSGDEENVFSIHYKTGILRLKSPLNYETTQKYELSIRAWDSISNLHSDTRCVIKIKDVNDNAPKFEKFKYETRVSEAALPGQHILQLQATDLDTALGGTIDYKCADDCSIFEVDSRSGIISVRDSLDAESATEHEFKVLALDRGSPSLTGSTLVKVTVIDFNDNSPIWSQNVYYSRVSLEASVGHIVTVVAAHDPDVSDEAESSLEYHIISGDPLSIFSLETHSGKLSIVVPEHLVSGVRINLNISASDKVHVSFTTLSIDVLPANHHAPRFTKPIYEGEVWENEAPGEFITTVQAHDEDAGRYALFNYKIIGQEKYSMFSIDNNGNLYSEVSFDRETDHFHDIIIQTEDSGGLAEFAKVRVYVKDKNDNSPVFAISEYQANVPVDTEIGVEILKVRAEDKDTGENGQIWYDIYDDENDAHNWFKIDERTGSVSLTKTVRDKVNEVFQFFIRATDSGLSQRNRAQVPITVFLIDVFEHAPKCPKKYTQFFISEQDSEGTVVTTLWNSGPLSVEYSLINENADSSPFELNSRSEVVVVRPLNHEATRVHTLVVVNKTMTTPPLVDYMTISVVVMDSNDCAPEFSAQKYVVKVAENAKIGSIVTILAAVDDDAGNNGQVQFFIKNTTTDWIRKKFSLDPHMGTLKLLSALDRETNSTISFDVLAVDNGPKAMHSQAIVEIKVVDYNDNPPVFSRNEYFVKVSEDAVVGLMIGQFSLTDLDEEKSEVSFFIVHGNGKNDFRIDDAGQIYVARPLDREKVENYNLIVTATDGKFSVNTSLYINVLDVNDNGPRCKDEQHSRAMPENTPLGSRVVTISVFDADVAMNAQTKFSLEGVGVNYFDVGLDGEIFVAKMLDREERDFYDIVVRCEDAEISTWFCETRLSLTVSDVNDNSPEFRPNNFVVSLPENSPFNSGITKLHATDADLGKNEQITYYMSDDSSSDFSVTSDGLVLLNRKLDRETEDTHYIKVVATDAGLPPLSSTATLTLSVMDINDNPPEFLETSYSVDIIENLAVDTEIFRIEATSRDIGVNAQIKYALQDDQNSNNINNYFSIDPETGVLRVTSLIDYEEIQVFIASVLAIDGGSPPLTSTALLNVTIIDANDNTPMFDRPAFETHVLENQPVGSSLIQVLGSDADSGLNGEIEYAIERGDNNTMFKIDGSSGVILLLQMLDRETVSSYDLVVTARDKGLNRRSSSVDVKINVGDVNDNPPRFHGGEKFHTIVQENRLVGHAVFTFYVSDADTGPNGPPFVWEQLDHDPSNDSFTPTISSISDRAFILDNNGVLRLTTNDLNHKNQRNYQIPVRVWDSGTPPLSSDASLNITIVEGSRYAPTIFPTHSTLISYLSAYPKGIVGRVTALDKDPYDRLDFSILMEGNNVENYFDIDRQDGTIVSLIPLDSGLYNFEIKVSDGLFSKSTSGTVKVVVVGEKSVQSAVVVRIGAISAEDFLSRYYTMFVKMIAAEIKTDRESVFILGLKTVFMNSKKGEKLWLNISRSKRNSKLWHNSLDILIAVKKSKQFIPKKVLKKILNRKLKRFQSVLNIPSFSVLNTLCSSEQNCSNNGHCRDDVLIEESSPILLSTQSKSFMSLNFSSVTKCFCEEGFGGETCELLVNECGKRPCHNYEICSPSTASSKGYSCHCPTGKGGLGCTVDLASCQKNACFYPNKPLYFSSKSYAEYAFKRPYESTSIQLSTYLRTKTPSGVIYFAAGPVDYNILEISDGFVRFRWNCGSGEGLVRIPKKRVDDNEWHLINVTRIGTASKLSVDQSVSSGVSPGSHDTLNIDSGVFYIGAKVNNFANSKGTSTLLTELGLAGCLDQVMINGLELPSDVDPKNQAGEVELKRLVNVEFFCPEILENPGRCGSHPCLNWGSCLEGNSSFSCSCPDRFSGRSCEIDSDPCASSPCLNGGRCSVVDLKFSCLCPLGLSGSQCEYGVHCNPNPCQNGGRCEEGSRGPICKCHFFTGTRCEMDIDECIENPCRNGGTCVNLYGGFKCLCSEEFNGEYCSERIVNFSDFPIPFKEIICLLVLVIVIIVIMVIAVACLRRKLRRKRHQRNNRVKLTAHHVRNDLKNDTPKRNSKLCNVEADQQLQQQQGPLLGRHISYNASTSDAALLNTLKQLASDHEALELSSIARRSNEYQNNLNEQQSPSAASGQKPWHHHNNLNHDYFTPVKELTCALPPNLENVCPESLRMSENNVSFLESSCDTVWDNTYDKRRSTKKLLTFGSNASKKLNQSDASSVRSNDDSFCVAEAKPLLDRGSISESVSPLPPFSLNASHSPDCSFDDVLIQNNISCICSSPPPPPPEFDAKISNLEATDLSPSTYTSHSSSCDTSHNSETFPVCDSNNSSISPFPNDNSHISPSNPHISPSNSYTYNNPRIYQTKPQISPNNPHISPTKSNISKNPHVSPDDAHISPIFCEISPNTSNTFCDTSPTSSCTSAVSTKLGSPRSRRPFVRTDFGRVSDISFLSTLEEETTVEC